MKSRDVVMVVDEATDLAVRCFDPKRLNGAQVVCLRGRDDALLLVCWSDARSTWIAKTKAGLEVEASAPADVCDMRYFFDFLIGRRGRIIAQAGHSTPGDEVEMFDRFEGLGGEFGRHAHLAIDDPS